MTSVHSQADQSAGILLRHTSRHSNRRRTLSLSKIGIRTLRETLLKDQISILCPLATLCMSRCRPLQACTDCSRARTSLNMAGQVHPTRHHHIHTPPSTLPRQICPGTCNSGHRRTKSRRQWHLTTDRQISCLSSTQSAKMKRWKTTVVRSSWHWDYMISLSRLCPGTAREKQLAKA
jgi:hypothetical protein